MFDLFDDMGSLNFSSVSNRQSCSCIALTDTINQLFKEIKEIKEQQRKILQNQEKLLSGQRPVSVRQPLRPVLSPNVSTNQPVQVSPVNQPNDQEDCLQITPELMNIALTTKQQSCSIGNFAVLLVKKIFAAEELINTNCNGCRGKFPLNKLKLNTVRKLVFMYCDVPVQEQDTVWRISCIRCIDEYLRRDKRTRIVNRQLENAFV